MDKTATHCQADVGKQVSARNGDLIIAPTALSSPIYNTPVKLRLIAGKPTAHAAGCSSTAARIIRRTAHGWTKADHDQAVRYHIARYERLNSIWEKLLDKAMIQQYGRAMGVADYKVCAIGRDEFPDTVKRVLRHCRYRSCEHLNIGRAHEKLAKRVRLHIERDQRILNATMLHWLRLNTANEPSYRFYQRVSPRRCTLADRRFR